MSLSSFLHTVKLFQTFLSNTNHHHNVVPLARISLTLSLNFTLLFIASGISIYHHHHHVVPLARISLTLSRHFSLSFIASGRSIYHHLWHFYLSSSSCRAASTDIPDPLSPLFPIVHRLWQVCLSSPLAFLSIIIIMSCR